MKGALMSPRRTFILGFIFGVIVPAALAMALIGIVSQFGDMGLIALFGSMFVIGAVYRAYIVIDSRRRTRAAG